MRRFCNPSRLTAYLHRRRSSRKHHQGGTLNLILLGSLSTPYLRYQRALTSEILLGEVRPPFADLTELLQGTLENC